MFRASSSGVKTAAACALPSELGDGSAVGRGRVGRPARPRPTALLSPDSDGTQEAAAAVVVTPDDRHKDVRNMLSCI